MDKRSEKYLDLALAAKLEDDPAFLQYLLARTSFRDRGAEFRSCRSNHPWGAHPYPQTDSAGTETIVTRQSETDVLLTVTAKDGEVLGVHIENKIGQGRFTANQADMYKYRADHWVGNPKYGAYTAFDTILIAPAAFVERNAKQAAPFGARFTHEEIADFIPEFGTAPIATSKLTVQCPPCSFCGARVQDVSVGHRAMICRNCKEDLRLRLVELGREPGTPDRDYKVAGAECVFCDKILTLARFSLRRWIFGICDGCASSITGTPINYKGAPAKSYEF
jgi:hypothetical protein